MKEHDLIEPVIKLLKEEGYFSYASPDGTDYYDILAVKGEPEQFELLGVELKVSQPKVVYNDKISALEELPWIGGITKYHLARNMGLDCVKPDRHLVRLAERYGFEDPHLMCNYLAKQFKERVGTIDVILWRYCNLTGNYEAR